MKTIARAWVSDTGTIHCLSQMCEFDNKICPRIETCEVIEIEIEEEDETLIKENSENL
jgi:hypothetical protein